jgi:hypothetical protein
MSYEIDVEPAEPPFTDNLGVEHVEFTLGYDLDRDVAIVMSVMLVPVDDPQAHDLRFGIREKDLTKDWKVSAPDYSKEAVDAYIPKVWRAFVSLRLQRAVEKLLETIEPETVTMETYYSRLPEKALKKYEVISAAAHRSNYVTSERFRDDGTQKDYWVFTKKV